MHQETVVLYSRVEPEVLERAGWNHQVCKKWPGKGIDRSVLHFLFFVFTSSVFLIKYFSELSTKGGGGGDGQAPPLRVSLHPTSMTEVYRFTEF